MAYTRRYECDQLQAAYENACDCMYYGMGPKFWNDCGIPQEKRKEVWAVAWFDLGDGCEDNGKRSISAIIAEVFA